MIDEINNIIQKEEEKLCKIKESNMRVDIIYNLVVIKYNYKKVCIYKDIKMLIHEYINVIRVADFGYDALCSKKIVKVVNYLSYNQQISICNYLLSILSREFPEMDVEWVQVLKKKAEINNIIKNVHLLSYPKALLLYSSLKIKTLLFVLFLFFFAISIILLPAPKDAHILFKVECMDYSNIFIVNHLCNIITLLYGDENGCKITPLNPYGVILLAFFKITFALVIVNFVYKKISDKIALK